MIGRSDSRRSRPRLAVTLGDPRGIGPEVVDKALRSEEIAGAADYLVVGPSGVLKDGAPLESIGEWSSGGSAEVAGKLAGLAVQRAVELARAGEVDGIVTAPIDKAAFHAGGWNFPGHTEMLRDLAGVPCVAMMMAAERTLLSGPLRVVLATTHLPLRGVPEALTTPLLIQQTQLTHRALRGWWGIAAPKIALCAFNPHASDGGLFGDEEERIYAPALRRLVEEGIDAAGPIPADTVFARAIGGEFHAVVAPYHDVGMAPFKTVSFGSGVNVTLGLPFPRTSPDHGTALDIAGKDIADPSSMLEAIRLAIRLSGKPAGGIRR
jgi:4-hydroxythreonine-4-phosphate dehydrogenase